MGMPLTSSITKYGRPDSVEPASSTFAMLGWSISARACRSASKRAMTSFESMPGLMIFSATLRADGPFLLGHEDHAKSTFANLLPNLIGTDLGPDLFGNTGVMDGDGKGRLQKAPQLVPLHQQFFDAFLQHLIAATHAVDELSAIRFVLVLESRNKDVTLVHEGISQNGTTVSRS